jgi:AcrR family transcriptional regulator
VVGEDGPDAVSTRAVSAAAGVQAPTIYRLFGDKQGLLDVVASQGFRRYLADKASREPTDDPVQDLRDGWDAHVEMGLAQPALYRLMYERAVRAAPPHRPPRPSWTSWAGTSPASPGRAGSACRSSGPWTCCTPPGGAPS